MSISLSREARWVAVIACASLAARVAFAACSDIFQDEALYWWTAFEGPSFSPAPPLLPLVMRAGGGLLGHGVLAIRAGSLLFGTAAVIVIYLLGRDIYSRRAGLWAAALFASCPLFVAAGAVATPDSLLILLWLLFIYSLWRAAHNEGLRWWVFAGLVLAVGFYAKYMMVLALPSAFLVLAGSKEGRARLKTPGPWLAAGIGLALFLPLFLAWNWGHGWPTFAYHLKARHHWSFSLGTLTIYVLGHLGFLSPLLCVAVLAVIVRACGAWRRGDWRSAWVASFGLAPILFFFVPSVFTKRYFIREHWDAIGYAAGIIGVAALLGQTSADAPQAKRRRLLGAATLAVAVATTLVFLVGGLWPALPVSLGLPPSNKKTLGWRELASRVQELDRRGRTSFIVTDSFATAVCVGFHLDRRQDIYTLPHRRNVRYGVAYQLGEWGIDARAMFKEHHGEDAIYVHEYRFSAREGKEDSPELLDRFFRDAIPVDDVYVTYGGKRIRHFGLFECHTLEARFRKTGRPPEQGGENP